MSVRWRRRFASVGLVVLVGVVAAVLFGILETNPPGVRSVHSVVRIDAHGNVQVVDTAAVAFAQYPTEFERTLIGSGSPETTGLVVHGDPGVETRLTPVKGGMLVAMTPDWKPRRNEEVINTYVVRFDRWTTQRSEAGRRLEFRALGDGFDRPVRQLDVDLTAPWRIEQPRCSMSSGTRCRVERIEPGSVRVHVIDPPPSGLTLGVTEGATLGSVPALRRTPAVEPAVPPVHQSVGVVLLFVILGTASGLFVAGWYRRIGGNWVRPASEGADVADLAFDPPTDGSIPPGSVRVDDRALATWATTAFEPPSGLAPWQGGMILDDGVHVGARVAKLAELVADGYLVAEVPRPGRVRLHQGSRRDDRLGRRISNLFALAEKEPKTGVVETNIFALIGGEMIEWYRSSPYSSWDDWVRVVAAGAFGALGLAPGIGFCAAALAHRPMRSISLSVIVLFAIAAVLVGAAVGSVLFCGELRRRTPIATAMWLRLESFRRFLAASEAHHVVEAAERGVLRDYTLWAIALGEITRWGPLTGVLSVEHSAPGVQVLLQLSESAEFGDESGSGGNKRGARSRRHWWRRDRR